MRKIIIKNDVRVRHDYITLWIDDIEYHIKPEAEICVEVFSDTITIEFLIFFTKKKKIFLEFTKEKEVYFTLKFNKYIIIYYLLSLIIYFSIIITHLLSYNYPSLNIVKILFFILYAIFSGYWWLFKGTIFIDLVKIYEN